MDSADLVLKFPYAPYYFIAFALSTGGSLALTPLARALALRTDFVDRPGGRKIHARVIPLLGGVAIYSAFWLALSLSIPAYVQQFLAILLGGTVVMLFGLWDDKEGMSPLVKISGQLFAAVWIIASGIQFHVTEIGPVDVGLTVLWIVGLSNAINLLDNMDGLSSGSTLITSLFIWGIAAVNGQFLVGTMAVALVGACLGFLRYNFASATIFMGDAGSLFLGYMLSVIALKLRPALADPWLGFILPVTLLGLPILDTTLVTVQRLLHKRPVYLGGKDHCSHRLVALGYSRTGAVLWLYLVASVYGALSLAVNTLGARSWLGIVATSFTLIVFTRLSIVDAYGESAGVDSTIAHGPPDAVGED